MCSLAHLSAKSFSGKECYGYLSQDDVSKISGMANLGGLVEELTGMTDNPRPCAERSTDPID